MIIQNVTGRSYGDFFNADIASVIGVAPLSWEDIPGGFTKGAAGASVGARDLARIAYLTLQNGVWDSGSGAKQIVTAANLEKATQWAPFLANSEFRESPGSPFPLPADAPNHYGYLWWTNRTQIALGSDIPTDAYYMHGFRDNLAIVVPSKNLIVIRLARRGPATDTAFRGEFMSLVMAALVN
jgi:CubicO group peptidase (beta-lactamase class C family)